MNGTEPNSFQSESKFLKNNELKANQSKKIYSTHPYAQRGMEHSASIGLNCAINAHLPLRAEDISLQIKLLSDCLKCPCSVPRDSITLLGIFVIISTFGAANMTLLHFYMNCSKMSNNDAAFALSIIVN